VRDRRECWLRASGSGPWCPPITLNGNGALVEELTASNEELQSTNEELHSVNAELHTVNAELQAKIQCGSSRCSPRSRCQCLGTRRVSSKCSRIY